MEQINNFTEGKILSPLMKFSVPILLAIFLQAMYGAVDLLVVGQFGDASGVSAVATGSQIMQTITGIITGLTMGTTIYLGQKIGEKRPAEAADAVGTSICLFPLIAVVLSVLLMLAARPLALLMHAPEAAFEKTVQYVMICSAGTVFIVAYNVISGIFRGLGNSKLPLLFVGIACISNIIGDLILVGMMRLDAAGAAIATVLAQAISVLLSLAIIKRQGLPFVFSRKNIRLRKAETVRILKLGSPIALQDALTNVSFLIITSILNALGLIASASVGVSEKIVVFVMLVPVAYMSSVSAFVAQNTGAGKPERARRAMLYAMATSIVFGTAMFFFTFWHGDILASVFARDPKIIAASADYMRAYAIDCLLVSVQFCFMGYFNGCGKTMFVMIQGLCTAFLVRIPYSYLVSKVTGVTMFQIGLASPIATVLGIVLCLVYYRISQRNTNPAAIGRIKNTAHPD